MGSLLTQGGDWRLRDWGLETGLETRGGPEESRDETRSVKTGGKARPEQAKAKAKQSRADQSR